MLNEKNPKNNKKVKNIKSKKKKELKFCRQEHETWNVINILRIKDYGCKVRNKGA